MNGFSIPLFPAGNDAVTLTTTVWIGVLVVAFFNLRLGWPMSGLIVPGYLVPLLIAKPLSATVILVEAVLTYGVVYVLSEKARLLGAWCSFFGRDRFFLFVLVSVLMRALLDGWLLPLGAQTIEQTWAVSIDYQNDLHSYGLLIVALVANYFWKPGLCRGMLPLACVMIITFVLVRYGLAEIFNLNMGRLNYLYDDIASSLLASPKAYIIIVTSAWLASYFNIKYGWEYSGILIPALLSLLWHDPWKIVVTVLESIVIMAVGSLVLRFPIWRQLTMKGSRKLALFFTVCFGYRLVIAHIAQHISLFEHVTDNYGFGYLLTTLLAIRSHERGATIRVMRGTLQASMLGAVAGAALGFLMTWVPTPPPATDIPLSTAPPFSLQTTDQLLPELLSDCKVELYQKRIPGSYIPPTQRDLDKFAIALRHLIEYRLSKNLKRIDSATNLLHQLQYELIHTEARYLVLREKGRSRGWGTYVLNLHTHNGLTIEVPAPLDEWGTIESAALLFRQFDASALSIGGASQRTNEDGASNVLESPNTLFSIFHYLLGRGETLQIRGDTALRKRPVAPRDSLDSSPHTSSPNSLWISHRIPTSLLLSELSRLVPSYDVLWSTPGSVNILREQSPTGFAELYLSRGDRRRLLANWHQSGLSVDHQGSVIQTESELSTWVYARGESIARRGSNAYEVASVEEMLFVDEEVLRPFLDVVTEAPTSGPFPAELLAELRGVAASAAAIGYEVHHIYDNKRNLNYLALSEREPLARHWGTYVFRCGGCRPFIVEIPRPLFESFAFDVGVSIFQRLQGSAMLIAGTHPHANNDGSSNLSRANNSVNLFNLAHQVLLREWDGVPCMVVQCRAIRAPVDADLVLAPYQGVTTREKLSFLGQELVSTVEDDGFTWKLADGSADTAGYELSFPVSTTPIEHSQNKDLITVWVSPTLRRIFHQQRDNGLLLAQFEAAQIRSYHVDLFEHLSSSPKATALKPLPDDLVASLRRFLQNMDVVALVDLRNRYATYSWQHVVDVASGQAFLLVAHDDSSLPEIWNLNGGLREDSHQYTAYELSRGTIDSFIRRRASHLVWELRP
jgi:hypothetical protein